MRRLLRGFLGRKCGGWWRRRRGRCFSRVFGRCGRTGGLVGIEKSVVMGCCEAYLDGHEDVVGLRVGFHFFEHAGPVAAVAKGDGCCAAVA